MAKKFKNWKMSVATLKKLEKMYDAHSKWEREHKDEIMAKAEEDDQKVAIALDTIFAQKQRYDQDQASLGQ